MMSEVWGIWSRRVGNVILVAWGGGVDSTNFDAGGEGTRGPCRPNYVADGAGRR